MCENNVTQLLSWLPQISNINMRRSRQSLAWDHFKQKNYEVGCKHCKAMYKYNTTMIPMMWHLNNVTSHLTLVNVNASSCQPTVTSV